MSSTFYISLVFFCCLVGITLFWASRIFFRRRSLFRQIQQDALNYQSELTKAQEKIQALEAREASASSRILDLTRTLGEMQGKLTDRESHASIIKAQWERQLREKAEHVDSLEKENQNKQALILELSEAKASLVNKAAMLESQSSLWKQQQDESLKTLKIEFENLFNKYVENNSEKLQKNANSKIGSMVDGLHLQFKNFSEKVERLSETDGKERVALKTEISRLVAIGDQMTEKTTNLTKAMTTNTKVQGNWGEAQLERALEISGLIKGQDFTLQSHGIALENEQGQRQLPDAIIHLPDKKQLVIDAKVSLNSYMRYCNEDCPKSRAAHMQEFVRCIKKHIDSLSSKEYQSHKNLSSPGFILMYFPLEGGLVEARRHDPNLTTYAWKKGVAISTSSTLIPILSTVASLWKIENQNRHAIEIAEEGGKLHDKFVDFVKDLQSIGKGLDSAQKSFSDSMNKLSTGRGNIIKRTQKMIKLGAKAKKDKELPKDIIEQAQLPPSSYVHEPTQENSI